MHGLQVLADGVDLRDLDAQWFRAQLGVVSQELSLFSDSVAANICYGLPGTSRVSEGAAFCAATSCRTASCIAQHTGKGLWSGM